MAILEHLSIKAGWTLSDQIARASAKALGSTGPATPKTAKGFNKFVNRPGIDGGSQPTEDESHGRTQEYPDEQRERAVPMVVDAEQDHGPARRRAGGSESSWRQP